MTGFHLRGKLRTFERCWLTVLSPRVDRSPIEKLRRVRNRCTSRGSPRIVPDVVSIISCSTLFDSVRIDPANLLSFLLLLPPRIRCAQSVLKAKYKSSAAREFTRRVRAPDKYLTGRYLAPRLLTLSRGRDRASTRIPRLRYPS